MTKPPTWYYAVAGVLTLWALIGCYAYLAQVTMSAADFAKMPQAQQDMTRGLPTWITAAYAIAVWGALAGAICLLLRMKAWTASRLMSAGTSTLS